MDPVISWLMEGDPAIRWQTMRDLLDAPEPDWQAERQRTLTEGWGALFLAKQDPDGRWGSGVYSPKWVSTTYTLLNLCSIGIPPNQPAAQAGARLVIDHMLGPVRDAQFLKNLAALDRCIVGMILQLSVYFGLDDERIPALVDNLLVERMPDGAWNCRRGRDRKVHHSSFHTTFNVLGGVREYLEHASPYRRDELMQAEQSALDVVLEHNLYKSDKTGEVIRPTFVMLSFPHYWHYDVLRGLEYFARANAPRDPRIQDAIDLLMQKRRQDGFWPVQHKYSGKVYFNMEKTGGPSRWNTLRALRVLRWWNN